MARSRRRGALALLTLFALSTASPVSGHLDPPSPPKKEEFAYLHQLILKTDQDDGANAFLFDGETEILIEVKSIHPGHHTTVFWLFVDEIDMDGSNQTSYAVIDQTMTRPERKHAQQLFFDHFECTPTASLNMTITVWELNSINLSDVLKKVGEGLGSLIDLPIANGSKVIAGVAEAAGQAIDEIGNKETPLGSMSFDVPEGVSALQSPTTDFDFKTEYVIKTMDEASCAGAQASAAEDRLKQPTTPLEHEIYSLYVKGYDGEHPFTKNHSELETRLAALQEAIVLTGQIRAEEGEVRDDIEGTQRVLKDLISNSTCNAYETEIEEGEARGVVLTGERNRLTSARQAIAGQNQQLALDSCAQGLRNLLAANHPEFNAHIVPTLSTWGLLLLAFATLGMAMRRLRA